MYLHKPKEDQFHPNYGVYINAVPEGDPVQLLLDQERELLALYGSFNEEQGMYRYSEGKWSLKEVLGHMMDTERIMTYRLLCAARGDTTPLPRHAEVFVNLTNFDSRTLADLVAEFRTIRASAISLVQGLTVEELQRSAEVNQAVTSASALTYFIIGHALHHLNIVKERYLPQL